MADYFSAKNNLYKIDESVTNDLKQTGYLFIFKL